LWRWFVRLVEQGKDPLSFPIALASYAARAVKCGRRLCGQPKGKDALSFLAQQRHGFGVEPLPHCTASRHEERYSTVRGDCRRRWRQAGAQPFILFSFFSHFLMDRAEDGGNISSSGWPLRP
jgi:hypothetical protein